MPLLLESIKKQSFKDFELILADAGSTDKTVEIAKSFGCRIVPGGLPAKGRNEGAKAAQGNLLFFLDADAQMPENFLEKTLKEFEARNLDMASFCLIPISKSLVSQFLMNFFYNWPIFLMGGFLPHAAMGIMVKKEIFEKAGQFDEDIKLSEDHWLARQAKKIAKAKFGIIKLAKLFVSDRRFEEDGWIKTGFKYFLCELHLLFIGPVKNDIFKYRFGHYNKKNMKRKIGLFVLLVFVYLLLGYFLLQSPDKQPVAENPLQNNTTPVYKSDIAYEQAIIDAVKQASPSVVSIIISKNVPIYEQQWINPFFPQYVEKGSKLQEVGAGSGFIVSPEGLIVTNKHVVLDNQAEYTVFTNDSQKYKAKVLALDPVQDLAVIKIQDAGKTFPAIKLGDSSGIQIGQGVIAIGNALGEFSNTVSAGIVSGLQRTISASDKLGSFSETLQGIIQTDAAINSGNSGGPLINLKGEVIGVNTAVAQGAQNIGFAIPINIAKKDISQVVKNNKIVYPFLGVKYVSVNAEVKQKYNLTVDYGALILEVLKETGIKANDVILEFNKEKITAQNSMSQIISKYNPGDKVTLKILRDSKEININVTLGERPS